MNAEINPKNFRRICGLNGLTVVELAKQIIRHRDTLNRAVRNPSQFKPTYERILKALPIRQTPSRKSAQRAH